jgi:gamma-glutamyltranspeptidase/glutathione hydrolase/leukotriene-C4 hydrolase
LINRTIVLFYLSFLKFHIFNSAIPGELKGYEEAHKRFGKLPWKDLFQPTIELCEKGVQVSSSLANALQGSEEKIKENKPLADVLIDPVTNRVFKRGDVIRLTKLANTLRLVSEHGVAEFYNGSLTETMVKEINDNGGAVTTADFRDYSVEVDEDRFAIRLDDEYTAYASTPPSSGILVAFILKLMRKFVPDDSLLNDFQSYELYHHRLTEVFKHAYAQRSYLGDEEYLKLDEVIYNCISLYSS